MTAINQTTGQTLCDHVRVCDNPWTRFWGLMGKSGLPKGHGVWITPCAQIHSFFMRFAFDAVFIDAKGTVVHIIESMRPWRVSVWAKGTKGVLELPVGTIQATQTQMGHTLTHSP